MIKANKPFLLEGAKNIRELGGYPTKDGKATKTGVFLRSDGTHELSENDLMKLKSLGVTLVVDLRSPDEVEKQPSKLKDLDFIKHRNVFMFDGMQSAFFEDELPSSMSQLYIALLDEAKDRYNEIFTLFAQNKDGASLFNCTVGKDRTGVVAMLLLQLAGVEDGIIIEDYAASRENMKGVFSLQRQKLEKQNIEVPDFVFNSPPQAMRKTLDYLYDNYQNAQNYLKICGVTQENIDKIKNKFV